MLMFAPMLPGCCCPWSGESAGDAMCILQVGFDGGGGQAGKTPAHPHPPFLPGDAGLWRRGSGPDRVALGSKIRWHCGCAWCSVEDWVCSLQTAFYPAIGCGAW
ncbi:uncharacterized protein K452DRAFT_135567 [Aplosporella prunicola CBS 121167]|uniref:Uncharacterized protein n=1 Tax=Aplosporella prunicola CBS 121167 TaxID=1176127 RepID=A0A6A6BQU4_9PEZI|nr:uncharacterized protein K452DRAFT_135567 [Aplosporella prunicola CBS 121167]KAF2145177.1 hypothetical protein K452DRAFT_135567 [Aplosporella prunicola CBS 121167]